MENPVILLSVLKNLSNSSKSATDSSCTGMLEPLANTADSVFSPSNLKDQEKFMLEYIMIDVKLKGTARAALTAATEDFRFC